MSRRDGSCELGITYSVQLSSVHLDTLLKREVLRGYRPAERGAFKATPKLCFGHGGRAQVFMEAVPDD